MGIHLQSDSSLGHLMGQNLKEFSKFSCLTSSLFYMKVGHRLALLKFRSAALKNNKMGFRNGFYPNATACHNNQFLLGLG